MNTRDKIKFAAIEMFNEKGATNVSTVQLSEQLGISPGNLYYYFDNKEHLIRDIWTEEIITSVDMLFYREDFGHSENGILNFFTDYSKSIYKYRFYYAEVFVLLKNDPIMKELYISRFNKLRNQLLSVMKSWEETGIMKTKTSKKRRELLVDDLWIIIQTWINFATTVTPTLSEGEVVNDSVVHVYSLLSPHFTDAAQNRISVLLKKKNIDPMPE